MRTVQSLYLSIVLLFAAGCGSDEKSESNAIESTADSGTGIVDTHLNPSALEELEALNATEFEGQAVVTDTAEVNGMTQVTFEPGSGPICLEGADFSIFYIDRDSDKTMILLGGGGACWGDFCMAEKEVLAPTMIGPASSDPENYFSDWNLVYVPYCDGSVFSGANEITLADGTTRYYHGRQNLAAAFDQAKAHFGDSTKVLIGGFSAGGYGTITGMVGVRLTFPEVDIFVMNDSGPGVQNPANEEATKQRIEEWRFDETIPSSCTECDGGYGQTTAMYTWMLDNDDSIKISILSYYEDAVIGGAFNQMNGSEYKELLLTETNKVHDAYPDRFKRFMLPGQNHVVSLLWDTVTADGVKESDWVAAMVTGDDSVWTDILASGP